MSDFMLPDEIWISILHHVPITDRVLSVQFVSKRFHSLCWDHALNRHADFSNELCLGEEDCVQIIRRTKTHLRHLSFQDCHWISGSVFRRIPNLDMLCSLNVIGLPLTGIQLYHMLTKFPSLRKLSFLADEELLRNLIEKHWTRKLHLNLTHLHIIFLGVVDSLSPFVENFVKKCLISSNQYPGMFELDCRFCSGARKIVVMTAGFPGEVISFYKETTESDSDFLCQLLPKHGIDRQSPWRIPNNIPSGVPTTLDFSSLRYLNLHFHELEEERSVEEICISIQKSSGFFLPNLECLIIKPISAATDFFMQNGKQCCAMVLYNLMCNSKCPKLRCVNMGNMHYAKRLMDVDATADIPAQFRDWLFSLNHLEEVNLQGIAIEEESMQNWFSDHHPIIKALSLHLSTIVPKYQKESSSASYIQTSSTKRARVSRYRQEISHLDRCSLMRKLSLTCPAIRHLEIRGYRNCFSHQHILKNIPSHLLEPISELRELETLCLCHIPTDDFTFLKSILKNCTRLKSLTLVNIGKTSDCTYAHVLASSLQHLKLLQRFRLGHNCLLLSGGLFYGLCQCKDLEMIVLSCNKTHTTPAVLIQNMKRLILSCTRLHLMGLHCNASTMTQRKVLRSGDGELLPYASTAVSK